MFEYGQTSERTQKIRALIERVSELGNNPSTNIFDIQNVLSDIEKNYSNIDDVFVTAAKSLLSEIEADGKIDVEERNNLSNFISIFNNPISDEPVTAIKDMRFVLTGDFSIDGGKGIIEEMIKAGDGRVTTGVSRKTNYVVVGALGSDAWGYDGFGGKIKKALDLRLTNKANVLVVSEQAFLSYVSNNNHAANQVLEEQSERFRKQDESVRVVSRNFSGFTAGQQEVLDSVENGENIYLTGLGGTGKSFILDKIIERAKSEDKSIIACAPTGIAALNIGGSTIHRVLGIGPNKTLSMSTNPWINNDSPLLTCDLMIVDEISMCRLDLFDYLSLALKNASKLRRDKKLCQLIVVGDYCQLPPVLKDEDRKILEQKYGFDVSAGYAFMGTEWDTWHFKKIELTEAIRQRDASFVAALNACRVGNTKGLKWIEEHAATEIPSNAIILCSLNEKADLENKKSLDKIAAVPHCYYADIDGEVEPSDMPTSRNLELKPNARVMALVNNSETTYMNGSLGTVMNCAEDCVTVLFDSGSVCDVYPNRWEITKPILSDGKTKNEVIGTFKQIPLKLAYAITIHKAQGQTFDAASIYPDCWDPGQLYTALSRLTSIEGLHLAHHIQDRFLITSKDVLRFNEGKPVERRWLKPKEAHSTNQSTNEPNDTNSDEDSELAQQNNDSSSGKSPRKRTAKQETFLNEDSTHTNQEYADFFDITAKPIERKKSKLRKLLTSLKSKER